jgi:tight adherence protein C
MDHIGVLLTVGITLFCILALFTVPIVLKPSAEEQRVRDIVSTLRIERRAVTKRERFEEGLLDFARSVRARLGLSVSHKSKDRLMAAGYRSPSAPDLFFGISCLSPLVAAFAGSFVPQDTLFYVFAFAVVGFIAPDFFLSGMIKRRKERIRRSIPDAIDLLAICVDAGLGLDQALLRVSDELSMNYPDIHEEFMRVHLEQRAGRPRLEAWQNLARRTNIDEFTIFTSMLTQADRFGTPIMRALSRYAEDLRLKRRQHAEQQAAKTKIKIVFPLVLFIFPCLFIVLLAPALISFSQGLKGMGK